MRTNEHAHTHVHTHVHTHTHAHRHTHTHIHTRTQTRARAHMRTRCCLAARWSASSAWWLSMRSGLGTTTSVALPPAVVSASKMLPDPVVRSMRRVWAGAAAWSCAVAAGVAGTTCPQTQAIFFFFWQVPWRRWHMAHACTRVECNQAVRLCCLGPLLPSGFS